MSDEIKSAVELAMEKIQASQGENSIQLDEEQKERIAEIRKKYRARIAKEEITAQDQIKQTRMAGDPETAEKVGRRLVNAKARLHEEMEKEVQNIREESNR